jgi:hypothetical protein
MTQPRLSPHWIRLGIVLTGFAIAQAC